MSIQMSRVQETFIELNRFSSEENKLTRLAYSPEDLRCRDVFIKLCEAEGMTVRIDAAGSVIAHRSGKDESLPPVALGSHLDTVIDAGKFDGVLGVIGALEVIRSLNEENLQTRHPIELIVFACEESSRFNMATLASKVMAGVIDKEELRKLRDAQGVSLPEAFAQCGLDFENIEEARQPEGAFTAFVELHIEQGPRLEREKKTIGVVTGIAAPWRMRIAIDGEASHSGATAMGYRHDALLGAAELALAVEAAALREAEHGTVATTGKITVSPGVMNTVPGRAEMLVDMRGIYAVSRDRVHETLMAKVEQVKQARGLMIAPETISRDEPVLLDPKIIETIAAACEALKLPSEKMPSGAGHDAMHMARLCPTGMIFVPSKNGLSHNPAESTAWEDIEAGILVLERVTRELAGVVSV